MVINTPRLTLREFTEFDYNQMAAYQSDKRYLDAYPPNSINAEFSRFLLDLFLFQQTERPRSKYQLAIILTESNRLIGNCGLRKVDAHTVEAEIGYELDPNHWGQGFATEAAKAIIAHGFQKLGLESISASCYTNNQKSIRLLTKVGMLASGSNTAENMGKKSDWQSLKFMLSKSMWEKHNG